MFKYIEIFITSTLTGLLIYSPGAAAARSRELHGRPAAAVPGGRAGGRAARARATRRNALRSKVRATAGGRSPL